MMAYSRQALWTMVSDVIFFIGQWLWWRWQWRWWWWWCLSGTINYRCVPNHRARGTAPHTTKCNQHTRWKQFVGGTWPAGNIASFFCNFSEILVWLLRVQIGRCVNLGEKTSFCFIHKIFRVAPHCKGNERESVGGEFRDNRRSSGIDATLLGNVNPY